MTSTMEASASASRVRPVLTALRGLGGRATVGDVAAATGLPQSDAEQTLRDLLENRRGHLEVGETGALVYSFHPRFIRRDAEPFWSRFKRKAWEWFSKAFKVWIVLMLVVYVIIFVALLIAAMFAGNRDGDGGGLGGGGRRRGHGHLPLGDMLFWYWIWSPGWRRRPYYGETYGHQDRRSPRDRKSGPPFYKKVFAFVFGPDEPERTQEQKDREVLRFVRARQGVLSAPELVQLTGLGLDEAEEVLGRLMAAHDGDVKVADDGTILYLFPSLMVSAHGEVVERSPVPAWKRLQPRQPLTGNKTSSNAMVAGLNGFNLLAAATAPLFIFPRLGLAGTGAEIGLIWIPVVFSTLFFAVPAFRSIGVARENSKRALHNVRKVLMGLVTKSSLEGKEPSALGTDEAAARVRELLPGQAHGKVDVGRALDRLVAEFDGEVEVGPDGVARMRFPRFREAIATAHVERRALALQESRVGDIIYSSADDALESGRREMVDFDRQLRDGAAESAEGAAGAATEGEGEAAVSRDDATAAREGAERKGAARALPPADDLTAYLNDPLKVAFRDERELAAIQADRRAEARARGRR